MEEVMYDIMYYDYDGCGGSYETSTGTLRRTWEGAKKAVLYYRNEGFEIGYEHGAPVAIKKSGRYAYEKIYIEVKTVED
jgi:hypothetical protein